MSNRVTVFKSAKITTGGKVAEFKTFKELADSFAECEEGEKAGSGFVRGEMKPRNRNDECATSSTILIIDGDEGKKGRGAPAPADVHEALKILGLNHFIYTSHSHSAEKNKYRVVVEANEYLPKDLHLNNQLLLTKLEEEHISIKYVKEMKAWSQIWYEPRSADPSVFEYYSYTAGKAWEIQDVQENKAEEEESSTEGSEDGSTETLDEMYENIRTGKEYHSSLRTISFQLVKDGMSKPNVKAMMKTLMNGSEDAGSERWTDRMKDMDRLVDGVKEDAAELADFSQFNIEDVSKTEFAPPPKPPGLLGKFVDQTQEFMLYEDSTIAFVSTMFIMSSITGRKFNVDIDNKEGMAKPTALNMYFTLAAETGVGKSEIEDAVENCYTQFGGANGAVRDFFYKGRVTGPKAMYHVYKDQRSIGFIANEAGMEGQSKLGDQQGLKSAWLNLYGQGAWKKWTSGTDFSDQDSSIKSCRAVAVSRVSESTPVELSAFYRQGSSVENGLIPRENIFVIKHLNEISNRNIRTSYTTDITTRMDKLITKCHADVSEDTLFKPFIISVDNDAMYNEMKSTMEHYRGVQNRGESIHERAMAGRMFVKMLRYVGLITVFNKDSDDPRALLIDRADWDWAKAVVEYEFDRISDVVALTSGSNIMDELVRYVGVKFGQMLSGTIKNKDAKLDKIMRDDNVTPTSKLKKACKGNKVFDELEGDPKFSSYYKSGFDKVIEYMERIGYVKKMEKNPHGRGSAIQATDGLLEYLEQL